MHIRLHLFADPEPHMISKSMPRGKFSTATLAGRHAIEGHMSGVNRIGVHGSGNEELPSGGRDFSMHANLVLLDRCFGAEAHTAFRAGKLRGISVQSS